jgi:hypothetical protein
LRLAGSGNPQYSFICQPLGSVAISGKLVRSDRLYGREIKLQAKYIARWAPTFPGIGNDLPLTISVGDVGLVSADGRFRMSVPDLARDPLAGTSERAGELQIWAVDKTSGDAVAQLTPATPQPLKAGMGGLKLRSEYPAEIVFAPCTVNPKSKQGHDQEGFALRPDPSDACDR